mmetsp:Transcript_35559/g.113559  ORF Transcript_35559/g.113559 Transcript_35559/m.113559 type:complete len:287 (-) Transcript_35559:195-1055(-)
MVNQCGLKRTLVAGGRDVGLRLRLRLINGSEVEEPQPMLLECGAVGAKPLCPGFLLLSCVCLLGLVADFILVSCLAAPTEWPIRKRFFTVPGQRLGTLTFSCSPSGALHLEGVRDELMARNRFWIGSDAHWQLLEAELGHLGPWLLGLRHVRAASLCWAASTTLALLVWAVLSATGALGAVDTPLPVVGSIEGARQARVFLTGALASALGWAGAGLAHALAQLQLRRCSGRLADALPGGAAVTACWKSGCLGSDLSLEVEQLQPLTLGQPMTVLRSGHAGKATFCS